MSNSGDKSSWPNGLGVDPLRRLPSFKAPRDLSLGGIKPNKKVFAPNLNVTRNKTKGSSSASTRDQKKEDKNKKDHKNNKNKKNGPIVIKSSGVFSEGLGSVEKRFSRILYNREETTASLERPLRIIRDRTKFQLDKEIEDRRIKKFINSGYLPQDDDADFKRCLDLDAPIKLPMGDGGYWKRVPEPKMKLKLEIDCKKDIEDEICALRALEQKPLVDIKQEFSGDMDVLDMLKTNEPTLILLQLPASLPGRGGRADDEPPAGAPAAPSAPAASRGLSAPENPLEEKCHLSNLEEGRIGKLNVHRSGRVTFTLGTSMFEVLSGVKSSFHQEVVSAAVDDLSRSANLISLGVLQRKLIVFPDWQRLLSDVPT